MPIHSLGHAEHRDDALSCEPSRRDMVHLCCATPFVLSQLLARAAAGEEPAKGNQLPEGIETKNANAFFERYLRGNVLTAQTYHEMGDVVAEFESRMPCAMAEKCVDGRHQSSLPKGYPATAILNHRTPGLLGEVDLNNNIFNRRFMSVISASRNTPGVPSMYFAFGHWSKNPAYACAAQKKETPKARKAAITRAQQVRDKIAGKEMYVIAGMTNTDDMSEELIFQSGTVLASSDLILKADTKDAPFREATDVFRPEFLALKGVPDIGLDRYCNFPEDRRTMEGLIAGPDAPMFQDLRTQIALETYLSRETVTMQRSDPKKILTIFQPRIVEPILAVLNAEKGLPDGLKGPLLYQMLWNTSYTLHQRSRFKTMKPEQLVLEQDHAEQAIWYGQGFELGERNRGVLVKTGRGDDIDALTVAKAVLEHYRHRRGTQEHPPLIHMNVEVTGKMEDWNTFNMDVIAELRAMMIPLESVFGKEERRILMTYSYKGEKQFYPVQIYTEEEKKANTDRARMLCYPQNVGGALARRKLSRATLEAEERDYTVRMRQAK